MWELKIKGVQVQKFDKNHSYFVFQIFLNNRSIRDKVISEFKKNNIGSSIHYATPVPLMSYYKNKYKLSKRNFINAVKYGDTSISLPTHQFINKMMIKFVAKIIKKNI